MRCPTCQAENPQGAPFCAECGTRLTPVAPVQIGTPTGALPQQTVLQGRYVISGKLGQGGMGAVYRAADRRLSTVTWAVKEMSEAALKSQEERQRAREIFRREAEMLAALGHPNLPRVTDHFEQDGKAYLVMEHIPGETLLSYLQREGLPQPLPRVLEWAGQLCDVLEYLHAQTPPIIFRDLKPANIMITPTGQVKLIDFGIARLFKPGQARDTQAFGTVGYSAPEQYGRGQTDARSDVYSLGVLLHQLLTGYNPSASPFNLPPASQLNPALPDQVVSALARATESDPERRFASIQAFRDALFGEQTVRPISQPIGQRVDSSGLPLVSQPYGPPVSQPYGPPQTTALANGSRWTGIVSGGLMGLATLLALIGAAGGSSTGAIAGFGILLAFPTLAGGLVALVLGVVALIRPATLQTTEGRRHAIMGIASGTATLLLCCAIGLIAGAAGNADR